MKKIGIILVLLCLIFFGVYKYLFRAPEDVSKATINFTVEATEFVEEFSNDLVSSEKKYHEAILIVEGIVTEVEAEGITLNEGVFCKLTSTEKITVNTAIKVKGLYIGFDDLLEIVKIDQCSVVE
jgi:hypothetical protein